MKSASRIAVTAAVVSIFALGAASVAGAQNYAPASGEAEFSVMGGIQALNQNDTALADHIINVPVSATLTYRLTPVFAAEGDFTWIIPVEQDVDLESGGTAKVKTPDVLAYQANLRADLPFSQGSWRPYLIGGAGAVTFLSNTDENRMPLLDKAQTAFAINFGTGFAYGLGGAWALRADFREFVAFPSNDAAGLSRDGTADDIWMERGTVGLAYRF